MQLFTFSKGVQWAGLESLPGQFWPPGCIFDTPALHSPPRPLEESWIYVSVAGKSVSHLHNNETMICMLGQGWTVIKNKSLSKLTYFTNLIVILMSDILVYLISAFTFETMVWFCHQKIVSFYWNLSSSHFLLLTQFRMVVLGGLETIPAAMGWEVRHSLDRLSVCRRANTETQTTTEAHIHTHGQYSRRTHREKVE